MCTGTFKPLPTSIPVVLTEAQSALNHSVLRSVTVQTSGPYEVTSHLIVQFNWRSLPLKLAT